MRAILLALLCACACQAQSVKLPESVKLDPSSGLPVSVVLEWDGDDVQWTHKVSDDVVIFREHSPDPKLVRLMLFVSRTAKDGTYYLNAAACKDKKMSPFASMKVAVGKGDPKPPDPVDPVDPVKPPDAYTKAVWDAYAAETSPTKAADVKKLASLYATAAGEWMDEPALKTLGDVKTLFSKSRRLSGIPDTALVGVRAAANAAMESAGTDPSAPLTAELKAAVRAALLKAATALKGVK